ILLFICPSSGLLMKHPNGKWNDYPQGYYLTFYCIKLSVVKINMSWEEALEHCKTEHGLTWDKPVLASHDKEEVNLVWIGLRFLGDQWQWVSGAPLESDTLDQCPVHNRCATLNSQGLYETRDCKEELYFICE
uniref:C-type lectin domain-containing protein n=1 Tax=Periophthalmus magnuspinnatus TaxID=409849 RepID=A0A3B4BAW1_9GOBI